ncbi:alpha/beta hydrolase [Coxiella endosymbiont of Ornithodoros amblus]|nr:alpha/beta hydrolase [Coxiella endosymbiont of Ornithodoros amblus]
MFHEDFNDLLPTFILAAEFDVLKDEVCLYAQKLKKVDVPVRFNECEGMIHGFISLSNSISVGFKALQDIEKEIEKLLNKEF